MKGYSCSCAAWVAIYVVFLGLAHADDQGQAKAKGTARSAPSASPRANDRSGGAVAPRAQVGIEMNPTHVRAIANAEIAGDPVGSTTTNTWASNSPRWAFGRAEAVGSGRNAFGHAGEYQNRGLFFNFTGSLVTDEERNITWSWTTGRDQNVTTGVLTSSFPLPEQCGVGPPGRPIAGIGPIRAGVGTPGGPGSPMPGGGVGAFPGSRPGQPVMGGVGPLPGQSQAGQPVPGGCPTPSDEPRPPPPYSGKSKTRNAQSGSPGEQGPGTGRPEQSMDEEEPE
jgi:hypothetical protein